MTARPTIAAAVCWYDEAPEHLSRMVASLDGFADLLVTLDGAYSHFPHDAPASPRHQHDALDEAARSIMLPHAPLVREATPPTQAEKRTRLYRAAAQMAGPNGWVLIIDADEELSGDYDAALDRLSRVGSGFDCATVRVATGGSIARHLRLLRALDAITVGPEYHGMIRAADPDGTAVCIRDRRGIIMGQRPRPRRARELDASDLLTIDNDTDNRPEGRKLAKREYVRRRALDGIDL